MKKEIVSRKSYIFVKDGVNLSFSLRNDVKIEIKAFLECMEAAKVELEKELVNIEK